MVICDTVSGMLLRKFNAFNLIYNNLTKIKLPPDIPVVRTDVRYNHNKCFNPGQILKSRPMSHTSNINVMYFSFGLIKSHRPYAVVIQKSHLSTFDHSFICLKKLNLYPVTSNLNQWRYKSKKAEKRPEYDSDSDSETEEETTPGEKLVTLKMQSLRMDGLLKKALNIARNKIETSFYEGNIRINGKKPNKKSFQLRVGDEVDVIRGVSPMNPDFLTVSRIEVVSVKEDPVEDEDRLVVRVRRTKSLSIENYQIHPWKKGSTAE